MTSLYETENACVVALLDNRNGFYVMQLVGDVPRKHYRNAWEAILQDARKNSARQNNVSDIIFNFKDMQTQPDPARTWFSNQFLPRFNKIHPNMRVAVISPAISVAEQTFVPIFYAIRNFFGQFFSKKTTIQVKYFKKVIQAHDWLAPKVNKRNQLFDKYASSPEFPKQIQQYNMFEDFGQDFGKNFEENPRKRKTKKAQENEEENLKYGRQNSIFGNFENEILDNQQKRRTKNITQKSINNTKKNTKNQNNITEEPNQKKGFWGGLFSHLFFNTENHEDKKVFNMGNKKSGFSFKIHVSKKGKFEDKK